ncbi:MAG: hypothetical protein ACNA7Y_03415, partial [Gammaproteobacteria bacterium]
MKNIYFALIMLFCISLSSATAEPEIAKELPKPLEVIEDQAPLSLNFQDIKVRAALEIIADFTGLNIVTTDTVNGSLTLRLHEVPWEEALE